MSSPCNLTNGLEVETQQYGKVRKATVQGLTLLFYQVEKEILVLDVVDARSNWQ